MSPPANGITFAMRFHGVPVHVSEGAPLRKTTLVATDEYESYEVESDALCMIVDGAVYVHPERWDHFKSLKGRLP